MKDKSPQFVICIKNDEYQASLEKRKLYKTIPDPEAAKYNQLRVIDESGEDYLYPKNYFISANLSAETEAVLAKVA